MPHSRYYEKHPRKRPPWPDLRYNIQTGEAKLFNNPEEVPEGWVVRKAALFDKTEAKTFDRDELTAKLIAVGVQVDPKWGTAHLKKVLDDVSPSR